MPNYSTNLKTWGSSGAEFPDNYKYTEGEQPVDEWDNFFNSNVVNDIEHLINVTNNSLIPQDGTVPITDYLAYRDSDFPANDEWRALPDAGGANTDGDEKFRLGFWDASAGSRTDYITINRGGPVNVQANLQENGSDVATETYVNNNTSDYSSWTFEEGDGQSTTIGSGERAIVSGGTDVNTELVSTSPAEIEVRHDNTSGQSNVTTGSNSSTVIEGIDLDGRGHTTNINTTTRSLDDWADANSDVSFSGNQATEVHTIAFNNVESPSSNQGIAYDASEGFLTQDAGGSVHSMWTNETVTVNSPLTRSGGTGANSGAVTLGLDGDVEPLSLSSEYTVNDDSIQNVNIPNNSPAWFFFSSDTPDESGIFFITEDGVVTIVDGSEVKAEGDIELNGTTGADGIWNLSSEFGSDLTVENRTGSQNSFSVLWIQGPQNF